MVCLCFVIVKERRCQLAHATAAAAVTNVFLETVLSNLTWLLWLECLREFRNVAVWWRCFRFHCWPCSPLRSCVAVALLVAFRECCRAGQHSTMKDKENRTARQQKCDCCVCSDNVSIHCAACGLPAAAPHQCAACVTLFCSACVGEVTVCNKCKSQPFTARKLRNRRWLDHLNRLLMMCDRCGAGVPFSKMLEHKLHQCGDVNIKCKLCGWRDKRAVFLLHLFVQHGNAEAAEPLQEAVLGVLAARGEY